MNNLELTAIQPAEYLKNGFYDPQGDPLEGLNGHYSLAMAYKLRDENADLDQLQDDVDQMQSILDKQDRSIDENPKISLDANTLQALDNLAKSSSSPTWKEIFAAARPWVKDWRTFAALLVHLHRIVAQYSLIQALPKGE